MDLGGRTARLCMEGTQAEFERRIDDARRLFLATWEARVDAYDAAMAAHYVRAARRGIAQGRAAGTAQTNRPDVP